MITSIQHQLFFPHPPETVWEYLTNADLMELWLMKNDFQPVAGHEFQFKTRAMPAFDFDGICYCKVVEIVPFKKLSYSWKGGPGDGKITLDSLVVWKLQETDKGTELLLDHSGFTGMVNLNMFNAMNAGWLQNMQKIAALIKTAKQNTTNA